MTNCLSLWHSCSWSPNPFKWIIQHNFPHLSPSPLSVFQVVLSWGKTPLSLFCLPRACYSCRLWFKPAVCSSWSSSTPPTVWVFARTPTLRAAMTCRGRLTPTPWWVHLQLLYSRKEMNETAARGKHRCGNDDIDLRWCLSLSNSSKKM